MERMDGIAMVAATRQLEAKDTKCEGKSVQVHHKRFL